MVLGWGKSKERVIINQKSRMMNQLKVIFLLATMSMATTSIYAQNDNEFRVFYGLSEAGFLGPDLDGGGGWAVTNFDEVGFRYLRGITNRLYVEIGMNYASMEVKATIAPAGHLGELNSEKMNLISVPIFAHYTLGKYLFVNGGPLLDFELDQRPDGVDSQSGIGYCVGIGGMYSFDKFLVFVNPNFKHHALFPFQKTSNHERLAELGIQFGIGYRF